MVLPQQYLIKEKTVEIKYKVSTRGSDSINFPVKQSLKGEVNIDLKIPIFLDYPYNPVTGKIGVTKVKHTFEKNICDVDHLHTRATKE